MDMVKEVGKGRSVIDVCGEYEMKPSAFYARKNYMKKAGKFQKNDGDDEDKIASGKERFNYECGKCGFKFISTIPPNKIKCPDCSAKPQLVSE